MTRLILIAALALAACGPVEDGTPKNETANTNVAQGKPGSGFHCTVNADGAKVCTVNDSGMGPPRPTPEPHGTERSRLRGGKLN